MARRCVFEIHKGLLRRRYTITGPRRDPTPTQQREQLMAKLRTGLSSRPFLVLYDGPDTMCHVAAVSRLPRCSNDFSIGLGSGIFSDVVWEKLEVAHPLAKKHTWGMEVPGENRGQPRRLHLVWTRTRSVTVDGMARPRLSTRNWKLTEAPPTEEEEERRRTSSGASWTSVLGEPVLAVFTCSSELGMCGHLQVNVDHGRAFDMMVLITCLSLYSAGR